MTVFKGWEAVRYIKEGKRWDDLSERFSKGEKISVVEVIESAKRLHAEIKILVPDPDGIYFKVERGLQRTIYHPGLLDLIKPKENSGLNDPHDLQSS